MYENERLCSENFYNPHNQICQDCHKIHVTFFTVKYFGKFLVYSRIKSYT